MSHYIVIAVLIAIVGLTTALKGVMALIAFRSLGYGPAATNLVIGVCLSVLSWLGIGLATQVWLVEDRELRIMITVGSLIIKCVSVVYESVGYWRLYTVSRGLWYSN